MKLPTTTIARVRGTAAIVALAALTGCGATTSTSTAPSTATSTAPSTAPSTATATSTAPSTAPSTATSTAVSNISPSSGVGSEATLEELMANCGRG